MLDHMKLQQALGEGMQRRSERQKKREQTSHKRSEAPDLEALGKPVAQVLPAAQVKAAGKQERRDDPRLERPRVQQGGGYRFHAFSLSPRSITCLLLLPYSPSCLRVSAAGARNPSPFPFSTRCTRPRR